MSNEHKSIVYVVILILVVLALGAYLYVETSNSQVNIIPLAPTAVNARVSKEAQEMNAAAILSAAPVEITAQAKKVAAVSLSHSKPPSANDEQSAATALRQ